MEMIVVKNTRDGSVVLMMYGEFLSALERGEPLEPVNKFLEMRRTRRIDDSPTLYHQGNHGRMG